MGKSESNKSLVREQLARASSEGVRHPVVARLWQDSSHAQALYRERHGRAIGRGRQGKSEGRTVLETWDVTVVPRLLRRHAGIGGAAVANLLEDVGEEVSWWYMEFQRPSLLVKGYVTPFPEPGWGRSHFDNLVLYDELLDTVCRRCRKKGKEKGAIRCHLRDGETTVVCGASVKEMAATIKLMRVVDSGRLQSLCLGKLTAHLDLKDEDLALILDRLYHDRASAVAEAIRALRKAPGGRDAWLTWTLAAFPALSSLARGVRAEL